MTKIHDLYPRFIGHLLKLLMCNNEKFGPQIQKHVKELVGHELNAAIYAILFDEIKLFVDKFFDQSGQVCVPNLFLSCDWFVDVDWLNQICTIVSGKSLLFLITNVLPSSSFTVRCLLSCILGFVLIQLEGFLFCHLPVRFTIAINMCTVKMVFLKV